MSDTEYTPTLTGDVRHYFNQAVRDLGVNGYAAFDRAIAAHDAQVQAEALREAAIDFAEGGWSDAFYAGQVTDDEIATRAMEAWLNRRADRIASDGGEWNE